jgi:uncharacterized BrkB/YihY/UPF0761 family membrane protein
MEKHLRLNDIHPSVLVPEKIRVIYRAYIKDGVGKQSSLLTYYGFLSLFPVTLLVMTIVSLVLPLQTTWAKHFVDALSKTLPVVGTQVFHNLHYSSRVGFGIIGELVVVLTGAAGWAGQFQVGINRVWQTQIPPRGYWQKLGHNLKILSFLAGTVFTMSLLFYANLFIFKSFWETVVAIVGACLINGFWALGWLRMALHRHIKSRDLLPTAIIAGTAIQLLASFGGGIISYELKHLSSLYGGFALALGMLVWISAVTKALLVILEVGALRYRQEL